MVLAGTTYMMIADWPQRVLQRLRDIQEASCSRDKAETFVFPVSVLAKVNVTRQAISCNQDWLRAN